MLNDINTNRVECISEKFSHSSEKSIWDRSEEEDMQKAITYLYEFKKKLDKLHPGCINLIQILLQHRGF